MSNVAATNGQVFHQWQLPVESAKEPTDTVTHTVLTNELSDGYRTRVLFGSPTGVKKFTLNFQSLAHHSVLPLTVTGPDGESISREEYLRAVYEHNRITGQPFAYPDPSTGILYLVDFEDQELSMSQLTVRIYSTGVTLIQRRMPGVTLVPNAVLLSGNEGVVLNTPPSGDVTTTTQNGHNVYRLNATAADGYLNGDYGGIVPFYPAIWDAFLVIKIRETTFSNAAGILTGETGSGVQMLVANSGTTKFADLSLTNYTYRMNGRTYPAGDQQAPMNRWGIVYLRFAASRSLGPSGWQIGRDRNVSGTFAKMDVAAWWFNNSVLTNSPLTMRTVRLIEEHYSVKYNIALDTP